MLAMAAGLAGCIPSTIGVAVGSSGGGGGAPATPVLTSLELSVGELTPAFDPAVTNYTATVGFLTANLRLTPTFGDGLVVTVGGLQVGSGQQSRALDLSVTTNALTVAVDNGAGQTRDYVVSVLRQPLGQLVQDGAPVASVLPSNTQIFGASVAIDGDTMVVGAPLENGSSQGVGGDPNSVSAQTAGSGAVFVYRRAGGSTPWVLEAYLKASNNFPNPPGGGDLFGTSVAIHGDTIAVGAPQEDSAETGTTGDGLDDSAQDSGAVYVFVRSGLTWTQQAYLKASNTDATDRFGFSVALHSDTLLVGSVEEDSLDGSQNNVASDTNAGAAYVFVRSNGDWTQQAYLKASGSAPAAAGDNFGDAVALMEDTAVVGAPSKNLIAPRSGAAYVFRRSGSAWQQESLLQPIFGDDSDEFGNCVAIESDRIVVGIPAEDSSATGIGGDQSDDSTPESGAAYVFTRTGSVWSFEAYLKATNTRSGATFGQAVAVHSGTIAVGSALEDANFVGVTTAGDLAAQATAGTPSGAVYLFTLANGAWTPAAYVKPDPATPGGSFGFSVALDGTSLVTGAPSDSSVTPSSGAAHVFR